MFNVKIIGVRSLEAKNIDTPYPERWPEKLSILNSYYSKSREKTVSGHTARRTFLTHKGEEVKLGQGDKTDQIYPASLWKLKHREQARSINEQKNDRYYFFQN